LDDKCWHQAARSGRDVQKSLGGDPCHETSRSAIEKVRVEIDRKVDVLEALERDRELDLRDLDRLLDHVAARRRLGDRLLPFGRACGPAEDDALAAVFVVGLEDELPAAP